jgi:hypothetical protein
MAAICSTRFVRLRGVRKFWFWLWKMAQMTIRPMMTGSEPSSPCDTRRRRLASAPPRPG